MKNVRNLVVVALVGAAAALSAGCYVEPVGGEAVVAYGYEPMYYDGYLVYYDGVGRPYYYYNGGAVYIAANHPYYNAYVNHYRTYGGAYNQWYANHGYRYQTYRANPGYHGTYRASPGYRGGGRHR